MQYERRGGYKFVFIRSVSEPSQADTFTRALGVAPQTPAAVTGAATRRAQAATAAHALLDANMAARPARQPWRDLASVVIDLRGLLAVPGAPAPASAGAAGNAQARLVSSSGTCSIT